MAGTSPAMTGLDRCPQLRLTKGANASAIHLAPVADRYHQHDEPIVLNGRDDAVIADAIAPEPFAIAGQGMAEEARIIATGDALAQELQHAPLRLDAELAKVANGGALEFDPPGDG